MHETAEPTVTQLAEALGRMGAQLVEAVHRTAQLAGDATPEMRELFDRWIDALGRDVLRDADSSSLLDLDEQARRIGISSETLLTILVALHRRGEIRVRRLDIEKCADANREVCSCLTKD